MTTRSVVVRLSMDTAMAIRGTQQFGAEMEKAMDRAERGADRSGQALDRVGDKAGKVGVVAAGALVAMGKAAIDWESQWAGVEKTVDGTATQMAALESEIRGLARTMPATHQEIAATAEAAGQLGVAREDIVEFTKTMVMLGETTNLTSDDAATSIAQFMNVMGTASDQVDEIGNTLVDLGNKGASTEAQILDMAQRLSGAGALIGASEKDVLALASSMANLGIQSELGGGAIQRVFTNIYQSAAQGEEGLAGFAEVSGMSAAEFADQWANDPIRAFDAFLQGLGRIQDSGGNVIGTLDDLGIKGTQNLQVMLRLAGAGDMLTTSLDQSNSAWAENTALTDEYGKRAETTGAQAQVAWNKIKDAGIEAGDVLLPVVAKVAEGVGTVADAFGQLPGPVQDSVVGLLAITAVVGGGTWFAAKAISSITETRSALSDLATTSPRAAKGLSGVAKAGGALMAVAAVAGIIRSIKDATIEAAPGVERLTSGLLDLRDGGGLSSELDGLGESINRLDFKGAEESVGDFLYTWSGGKALLGDTAEVTEAKQQIDALDQALAGLVSQGHMDEAAEALRAVADEAGLSSSQYDALVERLPGYEEALAGVANSAQLAAGEETSAGAAAAGLGGAMAGAAPQVDVMSEALLESREAAGETASAFVNLGEGLNDSKVSLGEWIGQMREQADALRDFRLNAEEAGEKGVREGLIDALREAGPEGALRMAQLADATDEEIARANRAWMRGQEEIGRYTDAVGGVPAVELEVDGSYAVGELQRVWNRLDAYGLTTATAKAALDDVASGRIKTVQGLIDKYGLTKKEARALLDDDASGRLREILALLNAADRDVTSTIRINTIRTESYRRKLDAMDNASADGGSVPKTGLPYADRHPYMLADGEEVISNRFGQADKNRAALKAANRGARIEVIGYADGGTADKKRRPTRIGSTWDNPGGITGGRPLDNIIEILRLQQSIADVTRSLDAAGKNKLTGIERRIAQAELLQARRELRDARNAPAEEQRAARREALEAQREQRRNIRAAYDGFDVDADMSPEQIRDAVADFRRELREAGGVWTEELQGQTAWLIASADVLERETARREDLNETLDEQKRALEQLQAVMEAYSESVSGNFRTNPFNRSITASENGGGGLVDPSIVARRDQIAAAEERLAALRAADDGSVANAAEASRLLQIIKANQAQIDELTAAAGDSEESITGLEALRRTLEEDTQRAEQMEAALRTLAEKGLDTTGPLGGLYRELAASGDVDTATELSKLAPEVIAEYEQLWAKRDRASAEVAALATQAVYGEQQAVLVEQAAATTAAIEASTVVIDQLRSAVTTLGADVRAGAKAGAAETVASVDRVKVAVDQLPGKLQALLRKDRP